MECERKGSAHCTNNSPPRIIILSAHGEYKQTANRILRDFATFEWPTKADDDDDDDDESNCPSVVASMDSRIEGFVDELDRLRAQHGYAENSQAQLDPWLMQQLREVQARWSGPHSGYLDEVYGDEPTTQPKSSSDIVEASEPSSLSVSALIDALDGAFKPTLQNARWRGEDSDVSDLDLTKSVPGSAPASTLSWKTAEDCEVVAQRRHSLAAPVAAGTTEQRRRAVARWAHGFGAVTASI